MLDSRQPDNPVHLAMFSFWESAILRAGIELGVFERIGERSRGAEELAAEIEADASFLEAFLGAATACGYLEQDGEFYSLSGASRSSLLPDAPGFVGDLVLHITNTWGTWGQLASLVREGATALPPSTVFVQTDRYWRDYMRGQDNRATSGQAAELAAHVDLSSVTRLADLGGGMASYSVALCEAYPDLQVDLVDFAEPLVLARELIQQRGLTDRIQLIEGDCLQVELAGDYEAVLISGVVCISSPDEIRRAFRRAHELLREGGRIIVQDFMRIDASPWRAKLDALMDIYLKAAFAPQASDRAGAQVAEWLVEAGFVEPELIPVPTQLELITATRVTS